MIIRAAVAVAFLMALLPRKQLKPRQGSEVALAKIPVINDLIRQFAFGDRVVDLFGNIENMTREVPATDGVFCGQRCFDAMKNG